jgi:hypothetical protein
LKEKLLFVTLLFTIIFCFSQNYIPIEWKVLFDDFLIRGVEVLNLTSKKITTTNVHGKFRILAAANDTLHFISKIYEYKKNV